MRSHKGKPLATDQRLLKELQGGTEEMEIEANARGCINPTYPIQYHNVNVKGETISQFRR
ncbi:hypothetical protein LCGC14_2154210 [marine sediment metagenome]|uniref:Uncharacterized protein n=1 Tax=marine sediment metagenome TaxID=412755 RepID=A0A0F9G7N2_9ZZZZ|nr:hypothetical protein [Desulfobacterales bacterium]